MTIRHLKIFITVADTGKMSAAAEKLYISQPSVSQAIRELEEHYQTLLFERLSKKLFITEAGKRLYSYARPVVTQFDLIEQNMAQESRIQRLRIGGTITLGSSILSYMIRDLKKSCPDLELYSYVNNTRIIEQKLLNMELDVAIVEGQIKSPDLVAIPMVQDMLVLVCSADHPFAGKSAIKVTELNEQPFVMRESGSGTRELFETFIRRHHLHIRTAFEETTPDGILNAVKINGCLAVISLRLLEKDLKAHKVYVFTSSSHEWNRQFSFVYHKDKFLSGPILKLQEIVKSYDNIDYLHSLTGGVLIDG